MRRLVGRRWGRQAGRGRKQRRFVNLRQIFKRKNAMLLLARQTDLHVTGSVVWPSENLIEAAQSLLVEGGPRRTENTCRPIVAPSIQTHRLAVVCLEVLRCRVRHCAGEDQRIRCLLIDSVYVGSAPSSSSGNGWNSALQTLFQAAKTDSCSSQYLDEVIKDSMYS